jgi:hypothetical protein
MTSDSTSYALGPDYEPAWTPWFGDPDAIRIVQGPDGVDVTTGLNLEIDDSDPDNPIVTTIIDPTNLDQGVTFWARRSVGNPWSCYFFYTSLADPVASSPIETSTSLLWGFRGMTPSFPLDPNAWVSSQYGDARFRPYASADAVSRIGYGIDIRFDTVSAATDVRSNTAHVRIMLGDQTYFLDPQPFTILPGIEYQMNLSIDNAQLSLRKEALGYPTDILLYTDSNFRILTDGWLGLVIPTARECNIREFTQQIVLSSARSIPGANLSPETGPTSKLPSLADDYTYAHDSWAIGLHQPGDTVDAAPAIQLWETKQVGRIDILSLEIEHRYRTWAEWFADPLLVRGTGAPTPPPPPDDEDTSTSGDPTSMPLPGTILQWAAMNDKMIAIAVPPWIDGVQDDLDPGTNYLALVNGDYDEYHQGMIQRLTDFNTRIVVFRLMWLIDTGKPWSYDMLDPDRAYIDNQGNQYNNRTILIASFRKLADIYKNQFNDVRIEFNCSNTLGGEDNIINFDDIYPGNVHVDIISTSFNNSSNLITNPNNLETYMNDGDSTRPSSPYSWLACAQAHARPLGIVGWHVVNTGTIIDSIPAEVINDDPGNDVPAPTPIMSGDDAYWIQRMFQFIADNAPDIAYETYFNGIVEEGDGRLQPIDSNPNSSMAYRTNWRGT